MLDRVEADIDASVLKPCLAVTEVVVPEPLESLVETECGNNRPACMKPRPPFSQRSRVGLSEMFDVDELQFGGTHRGLERLVGRQEAAGKDVFWIKSMLPR